MKRKKNALNQKRSPERNERWRIVDPIKLGADEMHKRDTWQVLLQPPGISDCIELNKLNMEQPGESLEVFFVKTSLPKMEERSMMNQRKRRDIRGHQRRDETRIKVSNNCNDEAG